MNRRPQILARLEGDDLYEWARMMTEIELIRRRVELVGQAWLRAHGYPLDGTTITNDGYVLGSDDLSSPGRDEGGDGQVVLDALGFSPNRAGTEPTDP